MQSNHQPSRALIQLWLKLVCLVAISAAASACATSATMSNPAEAVKASATLPVDDLLRQADEAYRQRADLDRVREGIKLLKRIRAIEPQNFEASWRAARLNYTLGDKSSNEEERAKAFKDGEEAGKAASRAEPNRPEGHFWLGANYGGQAQVEGPLSGLSLAKELRQRMETVLKLDEGYQGGSAFMVLGRLDLELPKMLGGDPQRAVETLERGLRYGDNNSLLRLRLAEAYLKVKRPEDARREINFILNMKPNPDFLPEYKESVDGAKELLDRKL